MASRLVLLQPVGKDLWDTYFFILPSLSFARW